MKINYQKLVKLMELKIIDVAGLKKSGKTTVVENIVTELKARGCMVGTLKKIHIPDFTIDTVGKDTYRHRAAGAEFVISLAPEEVAFIKHHQGQRKLSEIKELIPKSTEFLICEELNEDIDNISYIITLKTEEDLTKTYQVRTIDDKVLAISGVISNTNFKHEKYPVINSTTEDGRKELVDIIINTSLPLRI